MNLTKLNEIVLASFSVFLLFSCNHTVQKEASIDTSFYVLAQTPPMGWNSWDCYGPNVTEDEVKSNADYMAAKLKRHGWEYIVVDIRWFVENDKAHGYNQTDPVYNMDEFGRFLPAVNKFPSAAGGAGFKPLADYVHDKGLKFGIHLMRGIPVKAVKENTPVKGTDLKAQDIYSEELQCGWLRDMYTVVASKPGAQEYYNSLFELYASWGVDFVKVDDLSRPYHQGEIGLIRKAIDRCGRPMVLSTSPGATPLEKAGHIKTHANMWRICDDFWDDWKYLAPMFERCKNWAPHNGAGHWADADMLPLGRISIRGERGDDRMSSFSRDEQYTLMNLWSVFRSPLMFGGDLPSNDDFTLSLITNDEVLAVNQHSINNRQLKEHEGLIVWTADVPDSDNRYVAFFNRNNQDTVVISVSLRELQLTGNYHAKDLWSKEFTELTDGTLSRKMRPHASALFRLIKK